MNNISHNIKFKERISNYMKELLEYYKETKGECSSEYKGLYNQYVYTNKEDVVQSEMNLKHYEASIKRDDMPKWIERLYRRQAVIELTMVCANHCRYCLRSNYERGQMRKSDIDAVVKYCKEDLYLKELLISGGDPLMVPNLLMHLISKISQEALNIEIIRIGTRLPVHDPDKFDEEIFNFINSYKKVLKFEIAIQINHPAELTKKACDIIKKLQESGAKVYSQNVLLVGINDKIEVLVELYDKLRYLGVEAHYLFHPVPIKRTSHFRMPLIKSLDLIKKLTSSGWISGRIKPMLSIMTDVGKVTLYQDTLGEKDEKGYYKIKTAYKLEDRKKWNPNYELPDSAEINKNGYIEVKYLDGDFYQC